MAIDVLFAIRGLLSFLSFTELTTAARAVLNLSESHFDANATSAASSDPLGGYVSTKLFSLASPKLDGDADAIVSHVFGAFCLLHGLVLLHLAVYTHFRPLVSLALSSTLIKLLLYAVHVLWKGTVARDHHLIFPIVSSLFALAAIALVPFCTNEGVIAWGADENKELLKKMKLPKASKRNSSYKKLD